MKKLTIEEKAKAYDEALELARDYYKANLKLNNTDENLILEDIFPELNNENERIRKAIIEFFELQDDNTTYSFVPKKDILAWLEKQGEKKAAWSKEDEKIALSIEQVMNCASLLNIVPEKTDKIRTWLKFIKERVGCEVNCTTTKAWNEEDEKMCQETIDWFEKKCFPYALESKNPARESIKWLNSLKERINKK